jgi:hypothetical protein
VLNRGRECSIVAMIEWGDSVQGGPGVGAGSRSGR